MAIYHCKDSPLIDHITVTSPRPGITQAAIITKENSDQKELERLQAALSTHAFSTFMDNIDGRAALQVRGLKDAKKLLNCVNELGLDKGGIEKETTQEDRDRGRFRERVRGKALFLSALFYDLGNAAFFASGIQRGRHNPGGRMLPHDKSELMIGAAFSVGDVLMTLFGHDKGDEELHAAAQGLKRHLHQKGIEIPQNDMLDPDSLHESGAMKATDRWIRKHIIHIKCLSELAGGLFTMHSALKPGNLNRGKLAAGFLISTGWAATFLLDKPHHQRIFDGHKEPSSLMEHITSNPRGWIARPLAMANNVANLWGSLNPLDGERARFMREVQEAQTQVHLHDTPPTRGHLAYTQAKQHDYAWNVVSACSFLVAHTLFGLSGSKRPQETEDDKSMAQDMVLMSANLLARQPEAVRNAAISETADYLSQLTPVRLTKAQVEAAITDKINSLTHCAWANRLSPDNGALQPLSI